MIIYRYRPPLATDKPGDEEMAAEMLRLSKKKNPLREAYENGQLRPRIKRGWLKIDAQDRAPAFPRLSEDDIQGLTFGVYQLRQASLYAEEHLKEGKYQVSDDKDFLHEN